MTPQIYNFKKQYAGDTFKGIQLKASRVSGETNERTPIDLTNVEINMQIRTANRVSVIKDFKIGSGITLIDAENGIFTIDPFKNPRAGEYVYDIQFTYNDGTLFETYIQGSLSVELDTTKNYVQR
jgi:DNA-binding cell septation regulator SpoVG